jgi:hypothetical protein
VRAFNLLPSSKSESGISSIIRGEDLSVVALSLSLRGIDVRMFVGLKSPHGNNRFKVSRKLPLGLSHRMDSMQLFMARKIRQGTFEKEPRKPRQLDPDEIYNPEPNRTVLEFIESMGEVNNVCAPYKPLATIQRVDSVSSIIAACNLGTINTTIRLVGVLGWQLAVPANSTIKVGDYVVFVSLGSWVDTSNAPFSSMLGSFPAGAIVKGAVKTLKIRTSDDADVFSEGICLPVADLVATATEPHVWQIGEDVTELLNVRKHKGVIYRKPASTSTDPSPDSAVGVINALIHGYNYNCDFPKHIVPRLEERHLKSHYPKCLQELEGKEYYITKMVEGQSMTLIWQDPASKVTASQAAGPLSSQAEREVEELMPVQSETDDAETKKYYEEFAIIKLSEEKYTVRKRVRDAYFTICSRNKIIYNNGVCRGPPAMLHLCKRSNWIEALKGRNIAIQGHLCGPNIHGNPQKFNTTQFFVNSVKELDPSTNGYRSYSLPEMEAFANKYKMELLPRMPVRQQLFDQPGDHVGALQKIQELANTAVLEATEYVGRTRVKKEFPVSSKGIIIRPTVPFFSEELGKEFSVKVNNQLYFEHLSDTVQPLGR